LLTLLTPLLTLLTPLLTLLTPWLALLTLRGHHSTERVARMARQRGIASVAAPIAPAKSSCNVQFGVQGSEFFFV
jgi:hypothetical protein